MTKDRPTFSIIVPAHNRPDRLAKCLNALTSLSYPSDCFEVIVVDDGSTLPLEPVVAPFAVSSNIILLRQPNAGPATARNFGATKAKGAFLAFTDDDCAPFPDWLDVLANQFAKTPDLMIGGQTVNALKENRCSMASQYLISYLYEYYQKDARRDHFFFTSNNLALPAELFRVIKGFDTSFRIAAAEDRELCSRWRSHGFKMTYVPDAIVHHSHSLTFGKFCLQHFNYGQGAYRYHQIRSGCKEGLLELEPLTFYLDLLRYPLLKSKPGKALVLALLLLISQVANTWGFFFAKSIRRKSQSLQYNPYSSSIAIEKSKK